MLERSTDDHDEFQRHPDPGLSHRWWHLAIAAAPLLATTMHQWQQIVGLLLGSETLILPFLLDLAEPKADR